MRSRLLLITAGLGLLILGLVLGAVLFADDDETGPATQPSQTSQPTPQVTAKVGYTDQPVLAGVLYDGRPWALRLDPDFGICQIIGTVDFGCEVPNTNPSDPTPRKVVDRTAFPQPQSGVLVFGHFPAEAARAELVFDDGRTVAADDVGELVDHFWAKPITPGDNPRTVVYRDDKGTEVSRYQIG